MGTVRLVAIDLRWAERLWQWRQEEDARRHMPLRQASVEALIERLRSSSSDLGDQGCDEYRWFVEADGDVVGTVTLKNVSRMMAHAELGYHVAASARRRGIGSRAVAECLDLAFTRGELRRVWATISVDNEASQALVRKLGFAHEGRLREHYRIQDRWVDQLVFGLLRDDWIRARP